MVYNDKAPPPYSTVSPVNVRRDMRGIPVFTGIPFLWCARQGAITKECKSPMTPAGGIISWTARVSTARWNLKEAAGKALV